MSTPQPSASPVEWRREGNTVACRRGGEVVWRFSFDPAEGKPFFAVLAAGARNLVAVHPEDHHWHYGLWFSWKFINGVNYWEETGPARRAEGATRWAPPEIATRPDGAATIRLAVRYGRADGRVELTERRELRIAAPAVDGGFAIDWSACFVAGEAGAVLGRTPMPGEPAGQVNGGYGGLGLRLPSAPVELAVVTPEGFVTPFARDRARPRAAALGFNLAADGKPLGGVAILNVATAAAGAAEIPWYVAHSAVMRFACAAILAPKPLPLAAGATLDLRYRILVRPGVWTPAALRAAAEGCRA